MSILKIVLIVVALAFVVFGMMLYMALAPSVKDVSQEPFLSPFIKKSLTVTRPVYLYHNEKGMYAINENILVDRDDYYGTRILNLPIGSVVIIDKFKKYTNNAGSGLTTLYALGEITINDGSKVSYEYSLGTLTKPLYSTGGPYFLEHTIWQDSTDRQIEVTKLVK
jgi:hypothetical protein